ncbi:hypothetical protein ACWGCW_19145 [Streptomyces sp. NPDC054933]
MRFGVRVGPFYVSTSTRRGSSGCGKLIGYPLGWLFLFMLPFEMWIHGGALAKIGAVLLWILWALALVGLIGMLAERRDKARGKR